jgi:hypothetical protein
MRTQLRRLELLLKAIDPPLYKHFEKTDSTNMFCCFRWLLILFKREFQFEEIKTLWEIIWTCPLTSNFHLFIAIAILNDHRQELFAAQAFDEVLKLVNGLSQFVIVPEMIKHAEVLYYVFRDRLLLNGPKDLCIGAREAIQTNRVENTLSSISGIPHSDLVLDDLDEQDMNILTDSDWIELMEVLEMDSSILARTSTVAPSFSK